MNWLNIATLGPIGYLPAPGTSATIATLFLVYALKDIDQVWYLSVFTIVLLGGLKASDEAVRLLQDPDPSCVVIDECIGTLITFFMLPISMPMIIVGTLLFRFFDISKCCGVGWFQQLPAAWGVIMDDIVAGVLSCLLLHLLQFQGLL